MGDFDGKRVLLTGASTGIGAALALALGQEGARVMLFARREEQLRDVQRQVEESGGQALAHPGDVTDQQALDEAVAKMVAEWGGVDLGIANAGLGDATKLDKMHARVENLVALIDVNVNGAIRTIVAALPTLLAQGSGHIVGVASPAGVRGLPGTGTYSASKAALSRFLESLRAPCRARGIMVTTVHPGFVRTSMTDKNRFKMPFLIEPEAAAQHILRAIRGRRREYVFPWQISIMIRAIGALPNALFDNIMGRIRT